MAKVELLAPARDLEAGLAAVECGADAVYIGGPGFGARSAAGNSVDDITFLVHRAHLFGVRVYATLNTLLMDDELAEAASIAQSLLDVGVDALIVQDMAYLRMELRARDGGAPEFHASTQTAAMSVKRVRFLAAAGFSRVVLERAMSLDEIRGIATSISAPPAPPRAGADDFPREVELEAFVHGAICVGFSGQCYLSRAMTLRQAQGGAGGERSGNRGTCSQPCRLPWDLVDGDGNVLSRGKHLLSVRDLDLSARLAELLDAGVTSLKIEGRLKDANYVRNVVSYYNAALGALGVERASAGFSVPDFVPNPAKSFTRGASEWFFDGSGGELTASPKSIGEYVGTVEKIACDRTGGWWVRLRAAASRATRHKNPLLAEGGVTELAAGDGICFAAGGETRGTNVNRVVDGRVYLNDCQGVTVGTEIFRNYDHAFSRALERSRTRRRISVYASVETTPRSIAVRFVDETGIAVTASRNGDFEPARDPAKMRSVMNDELSRAGGTIFAVTTLELGRAGVPDKREELSEYATHIFPQNALRAYGASSSVGRHSDKSPSQAGNFFIPISIIAALRREGLEKLLAERMKLVPERYPAAENRDAKFPFDENDGYGDPDGFEGSADGCLGAAENVTNRLAEQFYRDHGVVSIAPQTELARDLTGAIVMRSRHCLRRKMGLCQNDNICRQKCADVAPTEVFEGEDSTKRTASTEKREGVTDARFSRQRKLFLVHGSHRFRPETDCKKCETTLVQI